MHGSGNCWFLQEVAFVLIKSCSDAKKPHKEDAAVTSGNTATPADLTPRGIKSVGVGHPECSPRGLYKCV